MNYDELQQGIEDNLPIPDREELWKAIEKGDLGTARKESVAAIRSNCSNWPFLRAIAF
jgi:hypothetical protein